LPGRDLEDKQITDRLSWKEANAEFGLIANLERDLSFKAGLDLTITAIQSHE
jgi:hypothetical protein